MKYKIKSKNHQSPIPGIIFTIVFIAISLYIINMYFKSTDYEYTIKAFIFGIKEYGIMYLLFALIFLYFCIRLIYSLLSPPKKYVAILKEKKHINNKEKNYTKVKFETIENEDSDNAISTTYIGIIDDNPDIVVNEKYLIGIKEFNWQIKYVTEYKENIPHKKHIPNLNMMPVIISVLLIFITSAIGTIIVGFITMKTSMFLGLCFLAFGLFMLISMIKYAIIFFRKK